MSDDSKIVGLHGQTVADTRKPDPEVIKAAERLLERAKSGEIVGVAGAYLFRDDAIGRFSAGMFNYGLAGALSNVINGIHHRMDDEDD